MALPNTCDKGRKGEKLKVKWVQRHENKAERMSVGLNSNKPTNVIGKLGESEEADGGVRRRWWLSHNSLKQHMRRSRAKSCSPPLFQTVSSLGNTPPSNTCFYSHSTVEPRSWNTATQVTNPLPFTIVHFDLNCCTLYLLGGFREKSLFLILVFYREQFPLLE